MFSGTSLTLYMQKMQSGLIADLILAKRALREHRSPPRQLTARIHDLQSQHGDPDQSKFNRSLYHCRAILKPLITFWSNIAKRQEDKQ